MTRFMVCDGEDMRAEAYECAPLSPCHWKSVKIEVFYLEYCFPKTFFNQILCDLCHRYIMCCSRQKDVVMFMKIIFL